MSIGSCTEYVMCVCMYMMCVYVCIWRLRCMYILLLNSVYLCRNYETVLSKSGLTVGLYLIFVFMFSIIMIKN